MLKTIAVAVLVTTLAGCASGPRIIETRVRSTPESQRGYIVGTFSVDCEVKRGSCEQGFNSISADYRMKTEPEVWSRVGSTQGATFGGDSVHDYVNSAEGYKVFGFCTVLPPGEYEFYSHTYYDFAGGGSGYSMREKDYYSIPFVVRAGEISNIGRIHMTTTKGENLLGMSVSGPGVMLLIPSGVTDAELAVSKCPGTAKHMPLRDVQLHLAPGRPSPFVQVRAR